MSYSQRRKADGDVELLRCHEGTQLSHGSGEMVKHHHTVLLEVNGDTVFSKKKAPFSFSSHFVMRYDDAQRTSA